MPPSGAVQQPSNEDLNPESFSSKPLMGLERFIYSGPIMSDPVPNERSIQVSKPLNKEINVLDTTPGPPNTHIHKPRTSFLNCPAYMPQASATAASSTACDSQAACRPGPPAYSSMSELQYSSPQAAFFARRGKRILRSGCNRHGPR
jgi:hypothetical protein